MRLSLQKPQTTNYKPQTTNFPMLSIHLHNIILFAHHGIYEEEKILGTSFELNITVRYTPKKIPITHMAETIDYVSIFELVKNRMNIPSPLLETVITDISGHILAQFVQAEEVMISIKKLHPPIIGIVGSVGVSFELKRIEL